jgi:CBS domain-containing protein
LPETGVFSQKIGRAERGACFAKPPAMARTVEEIMNRELMSLRRGEEIEHALSYILALAISGAPVVDDNGIPVGVVSFRDLLTRNAGGLVGDCMTSPAVTVKRSATIQEAARIFSERGFHRLIVVDDEGHAVGIVSVLDCVRGLTGMPASHPAGFPHYDRRAGLTWSDDTLFDLEHLHTAPEGAGIFVLLVGGANLTETDVWIEPSRCVRARLRRILTLPQSDRRLATLVKRYGDRLRFRAAAVPDSTRRREALNRLREHTDTWVWARGPQA